MWIKCSERMPEPGVVVLAWWPGCDPRYESGYNLGHWDGEDWINDTEPFGNTMTDPLYWHPLPAGPAGGA